MFPYRCEFVIKTRTFDVLLSNTSDKLVGLRRISLWRIAKWIEVKSFNF